MKDDQAFTEEELELLASLADEALDDSRPTLSPEDVDQHLNDLYERTVRERRKIA